MQIKRSPPFFLATILALIPCIGALSWLFLGSLDGPRNQSVIDLTSAFQMLTIFMAFLFGITRIDFVKRPPVPVLIATAVLAITMIYGLLVNAPNPVSGVLDLLLKLVFVALSISICFLISLFDRRLPEAFILAIFLVPVLHIPVLAALYILYIDHPSMNWLGGPVGFEHVRIWGMFLATSLAVGFGFAPAIHKSSRLWAFVLWGLCALLWALLFWSGSRGALLGMVAAYLFSTVLFWRHLRTTVLPVLASAALGAALSMLLQPAMYSYGMLNRLVTTVGGNSDRLSGGRLSLWRDSLGVFEQHPIMGNGFNQFRYLTEGFDRDWLQAHSIVIQSLVDIGIVGAVSLGFLLLFYWVKALNLLRRDPNAIRLAAFSGLNAMLVMSLFDGTLYHPETTTSFAVLFALALATPRPVASVAE